MTIARVILYDRELDKCWRNDEPDAAELSVEECRYRMVGVDLLNVNVVIRRLQRYSDKFYNQELKSVNDRKASSPRGRCYRPASLLIWTPSGHGRSGRIRSNLLEGLRKHWSCCTVANKQREASEGTAPAP